MARLQMCQDPADLTQAGLWRLFDSQKRRVGKVHLHPLPEDSNLFREGRICELIEVAHGFSYYDPAVPVTEHQFPFDKGLDFESMFDDAVAVETYFVMCMKWKDGIAYRQGVGEVRKDLWEQQELDTINVMLG